MEASNGAQERAHVAILADRLPALRDALLSRPDTVRRLCCWSLL